MAITKPSVLPPWAESGDAVQPTNAEIQTGWPAGATPPSRQRFNWILNYCMNGVRYLIRRGLADWDAAETYAIGDRVIGPTGATYQALTANTNKTPASNPSDWVLWGLTLGDISAQSMLVCDEKSSGTGGGASIAGEQVRTLNTVRHNTIAGASLSSNRITLPAGTYTVRASAPAFSVNAHQARLYNYTDSAQLLLGTSENTNENTSSDQRVQTRSQVIGRITLAASKQIELRHYTQQVYSTGSEGLGAYASSGASEVYSMIEIVKEA